MSNDTILPEPAMTAAREQTMKELEPVKNAIVKVAKKRTQSDQLLRYAEFAGIPLITEPFNFEDMVYPFILAFPGMPMEIYFTEDGETAPWTDKTHLGRLVIADACFHSKNWPLDYQITTCGIYVSVVVLSYPPCDGELRVHYDTKSMKRTWADAVLAAVEEVIK